MMVARYDVPGSHEQQVPSRRERSDLRFSGRRRRERLPNSFLQTEPTRVTLRDGREPSAHCFQYFSIHGLNS